MMTYLVFSVTDALLSKNKSFHSLRGTCSLLFSWDKSLQPLFGYSILGAGCWSTLPFSGEMAAPVLPSGILGGRIFDITQLLPTVSTGSGFFFFFFSFPHTLRWPDKNISVGWMWCLPPVCNQGS